MTLNRFSLPVLALCIATIFSGQGSCQSQDTGDESSFVQVNIGSVTVSGSSEGRHWEVSSELFPSVRNNAKDGSALRFAFTPYFMFVPLEDGTRLRVIPTGNGVSTIQMRLALYSPELAQAAALKLSAITGDQVRPDQVQPLPILQLKVEARGFVGVEAMLPPPTVTPGTVAMLSPVQDIFFSNISESTVRAFTQAVEGGHVEFGFSYSYRKAGTSIASYTVRYRDIASSSVFQQLAGDGGVGLLTRDGAARVASLLVASLDVTNYIEPGVEQTLENDVLALFFDKMRFKEAVDFTKAENLRRLAAISVDPTGEEAEADKIRRTHEAITTSKDHTELNEKLRKGAGSASYGPFTASANFESRDQVNRAIKETFASDWTGDDWKTVPKTVAIYQLASASFDGDTSVRQVVVRPTFWAQTYYKAVTQAFPTLEEIKQATSTPSDIDVVMVPVGSILAWGGDVDPPRGWLVCNGDRVSRKQYPRLWEVIRMHYPPEESSEKASEETSAEPPDYFYLPNLVGRIPIGGPIGVRDGSNVVKIAAYENIFKTTSSVDLWHGAGKNFALENRETQGYFLTDTGAHETGYARPYTAVTFPEREVPYLPPVIGVTWIIRAN